eukprot:scaffold114677_cov38-Prasinocladus_malaysianus.AAC.2
MTVPTIYYGIKFGDIRLGNRHSLHTRSSPATETPFVEVLRRAASTVQELFLLRESGLLRRRCLAVPTLYGRSGLTPGVGQATRQARTGAASCAGKAEPYFAHILHEAAGASAGLGRGRRCQFEVGVSSLHSEEPKETTVTTSMRRPLQPTTVLSELILHVAK